MSVLDCSKTLNFNFISLSYQAIHYLYNSYLDQEAFSIFQDSELHNDPLVSLNNVCPLGQNNYKVCCETRDQALTLCSEL